MPALRRGAGVCVWLSLGVLLLFGASRSGEAGSGPAGVTITTDRSQYQPGDPIQICYTVPGPGPVEINDVQAGGANLAILSVYDDGTGWCFGASVTAPNGNDCLQIAFSPPGVVGRTETCFRVVGQTPPVPPAPPTPATGGDCGAVTPRGPRALEANAAQIEGCFYDAYLACAPATLEVPAASKAWLGAVRPSPLPSPTFSRTRSAQPPRPAPA